MRGRGCKVVGPIARGVDRLGGLVAEPPSVEQFVRAIEACITDPAVARDVVARMPKLRVTFVNARGGAPETKKLAFVDGGLVYTGVFALGRAGVFSQDEVETFFELNFFARERALISRCQATTLPDAVERLRAVTGRRDLALDFDLPRLLSAVKVRACRFWNEECARN